METSSSLFACNRVKTRASGALNFRSFSESTMHFQHSCSVETHGAPTQKNCQLWGDYSNDWVSFGKWALAFSLQHDFSKPLEKIFKQRGLSCSF